MGCWKSLVSSLVSPLKKKFWCLVFRSDFDIFSTPVLYSVHFDVFFCFFFMWLQNYTFFFFFSFFQVLPIYMHVRVLVSSYLFLSGYGHFTYFWQKGEYGLFRYCQVGDCCIPGAIFHFLWLESKDLKYQGRDKLNSLGWLLQTYSGFRDRIFSHRYLHKCFSAFWCCYIGCFDWASGYKKVLFQGF